MDTNIKKSLEHAVKLHESGKISEALEIYEKLNAQLPNEADILSLLGTAQYQMGDYQIGMQTLHAALKINPTNALVYNNLGNALRELNLFADALQCYDIAISQKQDYAHAHHNRGLALKDLGRIDEAMQSYKKAIEYKIDYAEPYNNIANIYADQKDFDLALEFYNKAIEINPKYAIAYFNKALLKLLNGEFEDGWRLYEWRWEATGLKKVEKPEATLWLGKEDIAGKKILVYAEQGLGDTLQFVRYIKLLKECGAFITLVVQPQLLATLEGYEGIQVIKNGDPVPKHDFYCPLLSLPLAFNTALETIPSDIPYLKADPKKVALWKAKLGLKTKLRIGLVWSGGFRPDQPEVWAINKRRNIPLNLFEPLKDIDAEFFSLQKGDAAERELVQLKNVSWDGPEIIDYTKEINDFSDTAAFIENLDLIISVDTSTPHMAGALGKNVWILSRYDNCWRWLINRKDSPWYPTATIFRQPTPGDWGSVIKEVNKLLTNLTRMGKVNKV